ncbi:EF-hand domain-containing protein [Oligoflexus tunisiensis]|uniref:EF-hand domain-containing protein n=1 Tax=Oligoflexus tunisiensis TaxID=708132 RepID=UPI00114D217C|nr:EF-hand domain-containing protein [Oligoflexus tunisiensis]
MKTRTMILTVAMCCSSSMVLANEGNNKAEKFQELDADQDGRLSRDEAQKSPRMAEKFDRMDADQDGFVTLEEKSAAKAQGKADKEKR